MLALHATGLVPGSLYASIGSLHEFASVDLGTGDVTGVVTGLNGPYGLDFVADIPEPGTLPGAGIGLALIGIAVRRLRR